ncbi:VOC family protein [Streptacidiphilus monticola]|jgi:predicted enzyme related to lactoylglutathione lyase|uniref:VOC family protein n=1 Tax=Streptacidiphilus monticola TaxID=2161674 RepID=A0ABW1G661_9ACTN
MIGRVQTYALDCPDPLALARFYQQLVGGEIEEDDEIQDSDDGWVTLKPESGTPISFQRVPGFVAPTWPSQERGQQGHIDIGVGDIAKAHEQVLSLGAELLEDWDGAKSWRVYADPAGHPFCLVRE